MVQRDGSANGSCFCHQSLLSGLVSRKDLEGLGHRGKFRLGCHRMRQQLGGWGCQVLTVEPSTQVKETGSREENTWRKLPWQQTLSSFTSPRVLNELSFIWCRLPRQISLYHLYLPLAGSTLYPPRATCCRCRWVISSFKRPVEDTEENHSWVLNGLEEDLVSGACGKLKKRI